MFDGIFVDDVRQKERCEGCEYKRLVHAIVDLLLMGAIASPIRANG